MFRKKLVFLILLSVLSISTTSIAKSQKEKTVNFKILSYNILEGLKDIERRNLFVEFADSLKADVITLQECNHFTNESFLEFAKKLSYPYAVLLKEKGYPTGILSKYPIENVQRITDGFLHGFIAAKIKDYYFINLHLNPFMYTKRNEEMEKINHYLDKLPKKSKIIIMGDFNSLSPQDSSHYKENSKKIHKLIEHERTRRHIQNVNNGNFDYSVINQLIYKKFIDTWKYKNKGAYEKSAPSSVIKHDPDDDVRIDYIWISPNIRQQLVKSFMIRNQATDKISDHYPQILVLNK